MFASSLEIVMVPNVSNVSSDDARRKIPNKHVKSVKYVHSIGDWKICRKRFYESPCLVLQPKRPKLYSSARVGMVKRVDIGYASTRI